jgi:hypothetical protein
VSATAIIPLSQLDWVRSSAFLGYVRGGSTKGFDLSARALKSHVLHVMKYSAEVVICTVCLPSTLATQLPLKLVAENPQRCYSCLLPRIPCKDIAAAVSKNTAIISEFLKTNGLPQPSFDALQGKPLPAQGLSNSSWHE